MTEEPNPDAEPNVRRARGGTMILWTILVPAAILYWHVFGVLMALGEHWPLSLLLVLVGLIIAGNYGGQLGIPLLFRNAPDKGRRFGPSFWSGFGVTLLCTLILTEIFICSWLDLIQKEVEFRRRFAGDAESGAAAADTGQKAPVTAALEALRQVTGDWKPHNLIEHLFKGQVAKWADEQGNSAKTAAPALVFVFFAGLPLWVLLAACVFGADPPSVGLSRPRSLRSRLAEVFGYFLGWATMLPVALLFTLAHALMQPPYSIDQPGNLSGWRLLDGLLKFTRFQSWAHFGSFALFVTLVLVLLIAVASLYKKIPPGLGICVLFCLASVVYLCLDVLVPGVRAVVALLMGGTLVWINRRADRYRFPGMSWHYESPIDLESKDKEVEDGIIPPGPCEDDEITPLLLNDRQVLERWVEHVGRHEPEGRTKPKLLLLAVTGAAYRASFWTTIVLKRLQEEFPEFLDHVRLVTGASGGMVGAAYAVAMKSNETAYVGATEQLEKDTGLDSLTPVVQQLIRRDIPMAFHWSPQKFDRGRALEDQWKTLDISFDKLRAGEAEGWRPSLVISPMVVETGRRLLFSNLDLYGLTDLQARKRGGVSCEPEDLGPLPQQGGFRRLSRSAVEFFRAFPDTYRGKNGDAFKLKTAVRMNATFPFITPAVNLPVCPPRRVVDAGYYDNYGINLAAAWAYQNRDWIRANTSGLAIVQIRAYESEDVRKRLWVSPRDKPVVQRAAPLQDLAVGVQALTTPVQGVLGAMKWSMSYRNDEQIQLLDETFNGRYMIEAEDHRSEVDRTREKQEPGWFESFVFENSVPFGMNWFVSRAEIERMQSSLASPLDAEGHAEKHKKLNRSHARQETLERQARDQNTAQLDLFRKWWTREPEPEPLSRQSPASLVAAEVPQAVSG